MARFPFSAGLPANRFRDEMERAFGGIFRDFPTFDAPAACPAPVGTYPTLNVWEDHDALYVEAELPGLKLEDLNVNVQGDELRIAGERKASPPEKAALHRQERGAGSFQRLVRLPVEVDVEHVEATLVDGVLLVRLPKSPAVKPRKITVKTG